MEHSSSDHHYRPLKMDATPRSRLPLPGERLSAPGPHDVVGTKIRTWHTHPGNVFYRDLVDKTHVRCTGSGHIQEGKIAAEHIVDIIMVDRRGVFLRQHKSGGWIVIDRQAAISKVYNALKVNQQKLQAGNWGALKRRFKKKPPRSPKVASPARKPIYQATASTSNTIHAYALHMISSACNQPDLVLSMLEKPLVQYLVEDDESPRERAIRLQLRHRYAAALASGMTPLDFSKKLLEHWGGSLITTTHPETTTTKEPEKPVETLLQSDEQITTVDGGEQQPSDDDKADWSGSVETHLS